MLNNTGNDCPGVIDNMEKEEVIRYENNFIYLYLDSRR